MTAVHSGWDILAELWDGEYVKIACEKIINNSNVLLNNNYFVICVLIAGGQLCWSTNTQKVKSNGWLMLPLYRWTYVFTIEYIAIVAIIAYWWFVIVTIHQLYIFIKPDGIRTCTNINVLLYQLSYTSLSYQV